MKLEQVKEHFKNAKEVKCLSNGELVKVKHFTDRGIHYYNEGYWADYTKPDDDSILLWTRGKGFAEITKYNTNDVTVSEQLVKGYHKDACSDFKKRIEKDFPQFFKKKALEVGKWYHYKGWLVCYKSTRDNGVIYGSYAFDDDGKWDSVGGCFGKRADLFKPATYQEVKDALIQEAEKRGFKVGVRFKHNAEAHPTIQDKVCNINSSNFSWDGRVLMLDSWEIFNKGKWATIVEETYKLGDRFKCDGDEYILAVTDCNEINFINLKFGSRWNHPLKVVDSSNISPEEFRELCDGFKFNKIS